MIKIVVADDHALVRAGICRLLEAAGDIKVVAEAGCGIEAIQFCTSLSPDLLLLDLSLPDIDGIEVTRRLASLAPAVKVLVLTMHDSEEYANRLMQAGAKGYLLKGAVPGELPDAVRKVASGRIHITPSMMEKMIVRHNLRGDESPLEKLSDRELQILIRLANGSGVLEISDELCISPSTVGTYKRRIMDKLELNNISELVRFAIKFDLITG